MLLLIYLLPEVTEACEAVGSNDAEERAEIDVAIAPSFV
jgi:hypothetical protein